MTHFTSSVVPLDASGQVHGGPESVDEGHIEKLWLWRRVGVGWLENVASGVMHYIIPPRNVSDRMTARREVIRPVVKVSPRRERTCPPCNL